LDIGGDGRLGWAVEYRRFSRGFYGAFQQLSV
jgi:hypothetical protein